MSAPAMARCTTRPPLSIATNRAAFWVQFKCANPDEVEAHILAAVYVLYGRQIVATSEEVVVTHGHPADGRRITLHPTEHALGLVGGPTQRKLLQGAVRAASFAMAECWEAAHPVVG